jgi:hypothetical protein
MYTYVFLFVAQAVTLARACCAWGEFDCQRFYRLNFMVETDDSA